MVRRRGPSHLTGSLVGKLESAVGKGDAAKVSAAATTLHARDAAFCRQLLGYKLQKHAGDAGKRNLWFTNAPGTILEEAIRERDGYLTGQYLNMIGFVAKDTLVAAATRDPRFFLDHVLVGLQRRGDLTDKFRELLLDMHLDTSSASHVGKVQDTRSEGIRATLRAALGDDWVAFAKTVPVLALAEQAREHLDPPGLGAAPDVHAVADRVFADYLANRGISIGYYTSSKDRTEKIIMGRSPDELRVASQLDEPLRTQCDDIMKIVRESTRAYPGLAATFKVGMEKQALLTKPLDGLPGGLVPNTFAGNVQDANGTWTNQIFFTGVTESKEPRSHTWLIVNGRPYDPVLGTSGDQVAGSVAGSFTQQKGTGEDGKWQKVWKDKLGNTLTPLTDVKAPTNPMGFGTAYRLTKA